VPTLPGSLHPDILGRAQNRSRWQVRPGLLRHHVGGVPGGPVLFLVRPVKKVRPPRALLMLAMGAEAQAVADATGSQLGPDGAVGVAAWRGREAEATELIQAAPTRRSGPSYSSAPGPSNGISARCTPSSESAHAESCGGPWPASGRQTHRPSDRRSRHRRLRRTGPSAVPRWRRSRTGGPPRPARAACRARSAPPVRSYRSSAAGSLSPSAGRSRRAPSHAGIRWGVAQCVRPVLWL
jgi:hypothetical protein